MPSLSQRSADIPLLFLHLVREAAARYGREDMEVPQHLLSAVSLREWPGNVRELRNAADRFALGLETDVSDASPAFQDDGRSALAPRVAAYEKSLIAQAIAAHGGNLKSVYENLGISRKTLYEKMQKYELHRHMTEI